MKKSKTNQQNLSADEQNSKGLVAHSNDAIYIKEDNFTNHWGVMKTRVGSNTATELFNFATQKQAEAAGWKIALAIGGKFYNTDDPRHLEAGQEPECKALSTAQQVFKLKSYQEQREALAQMIANCGLHYTNICEIWETFGPIMLATEQAKIDDEIASGAAEEL